MKHIRRLTCLMLALLLMLSMAACDNGKPPVQSGPPASSGNAEDPGTPNTPDDPVGPDTPDSPTQEGFDALAESVEASHLVSDFMNSYIAKIYYGEDANLITGTVCDPALADMDPETEIELNLGYSHNPLYQYGVATLGGLRTNIEYFNAKADYQQGVLAECYTFNHDVTMSSPFNSHADEKITIRFAYNTSDGEPVVTGGYFHASVRTEFTDIDVQTLGYQYFNSYGFSFYLVYIDGEWYIANILCHEHGVGGQHAINSPCFDAHYRYPGETYMSTQEFDPSIIAETADVYKIRNTVYNYMRNFTLEAYHGMPCDLLSYTVCDPALDDIDPETVFDLPATDCLPGGETTVAQARENILFYREKAEYIFGTYDKYYSIDPYFTTPDEIDSETGEPSCVINGDTAYIRTRQRHNYEGCAYDISLVKIDGNWYIADICVRTDEGPHDWVDEKYKGTGITAEEMYAIEGAYDVPMGNGYRPIYNPD